MTKELTAAQKQHSVQAANLRHQGKELASVLTDKQALEERLEAQSEELQQANKDLTSTESQLQQLQHQHQALTAHSGEVQAEMESKSQQLTQVQGQLEERTDALSALQVLYTGLSSSACLAGACYLLNDFMHG